MPKVYIAHGFAEGPQISQRLAAALRDNGINTTKDPKEADIVVAHSSGCFEIPKTFKGKTVLLAGPSTGFAGSSPVKVQARKVRHDFGIALRNRQFGRWFLKSLWNTKYLIGIAPRVPDYTKGALKLQSKLPDVKAKTVAVILYKDDPWSWYYPRDIAKRHPEYAFVSYTGSHDDLWTNPKDYITILKYLYET
ncbi:MAG TPA: hypothetical protein VFT58_06660 [Nitrososphaera sp.]|nr:hypothetical protein [Nitrososphaera sp.]